MNLTQVKKMAKEMGIKTGAMKKTELIHNIQVTEGNFDCFEKAEDYCDQENCSFRDDCIGS